MWTLTMRDPGEQALGQAGEQGGEAGNSRWKRLLWGMRREEAEHYYDKFLRYMHGCELRLIAPDGSTARKSS